MAEAGPHRRTGLAGAAETLITGWALIGGLVLLGIVAVNVLEVVTGFTRPWTGYRFAGSVELTEMGAAVAAFCFLPYCQLTDANVTAEIFTARASARMISVFRFVASIIALLFGLLLLWRMSEGMSDQRDFGYSTAILDLPIWIAYVPILISLGLLVVAALVTLLESGAHVMTGDDAS